MERQWVTPEEAQTIWEHARTKRDELYIKMLFYTGGRSTEVSNLRPRDIGPTYVVLNNLKQHKAIVPKKVIQIPEHIVLELIEYLKEKTLNINQYIFSLDGNRPYYKMYNWLVVVRAATAANVLKVGRNGDIRPAWPYCFRHGNAQILYDTTHDLLFVKQQLGHASTRTTEKYVGITTERKRQYIKQVFGDAAPTETASTV